MPSGGRPSSEPSCSEEDPDPSLLRTQNNNYQERCVDPPEVLVLDNFRKASTHRKNAHLKDSKDGQGAETVGFLALTDEPADRACACGRCRSVVCRVLTCGLYRVCQRTLCAPCLTAPQPRPEEEEEEEEKEGEEENGEREREEYHDEEAWPGDFYLDGVQVDVPLNDLNAMRPRASSPKTQPQPQPPGQTGRWSYGSMTPGDWRGGEEEEEDEEDEAAYGGGEGVDALIQKKLLALFTEYQIEELARCTTDSLFMRKSREISQLISSLAEEHQMDEYEAEGRLVRGIVRISTRRSRKGAPPPRCSTSERTLSDSGNETMRNSESCSNNNDYKSNPNFQISDVTHSDMDARNMRVNNSGRRSGPYTDTMSSSGVSVTRTSMRT